MSKNLPEVVVMSSNPDSPLSLDEPDFSGLMALTEASIRRKLSELKYPDSDFSSSQNEDDADQKVVSVAKNQPTSLNQSELENDSETKRHTLLQSASKPSASSNTDIDPQSAGVISNIEQSKINVSDPEHSNMNTNAKEVCDNSMNLVSALDDPEIVKLVSLSMKSNIPESESEQRVKYCGLSVELPIENKSPELRKSPEQVTSYDESPTENSSPENKSPELRKSPEQVTNYVESPTETSRDESVESSEKEMYVLEIHDEDKTPESERDDSPEPEISYETNEESTENENSVSKQSEINDADITDIGKSRTSPIETLSSEDVKYCGLDVKNTEMLPQIQTTHMAQILESMEQEPIVKESDFEPGSIKSKDETSPDSVEKCSSPTIGEISDIHKTKVDNEEKVKEHSKPDTGVKENKNSYVISSLHTMDKSVGAAKLTDATISEITGPDLNRTCQGSKENSETDQEIVTDKSIKSLASSSAETVEKENLIPEKGEFHQDWADVSNKDETDQILTVVPEDVGIDVDKSLAEMEAAPGVGYEMEQKAAEGDDVSENELGLVISGVCSTTEVMAEGDIQMVKVIHFKYENNKRSLNKWLKNISIKYTLRKE